MKPRGILSHRLRPGLAGLTALIGSLVGTPLHAPAGDHAQWCDQMRGITPRNYICRHAAKPPVVDGSLDDPAWVAAPWTEDFVDIQGGAKPRPRFRTRAKLLWDDKYLYIAAELEEPHVWGTLTNHDAVIFRDPDFEVFMDPRGETQPYYEFEMNALNTTWDLRLNKPYLDGGKPRNAWEIPGAKSAVQVRGTLNAPGDTDGGWTVELAFPWRALGADARHPGPPREGEQWRINFSRVEWQITTTNGSYEKLPDTPEDNWVWSPQGVIDMHRPEMWGVVQFTRRPATRPVTVAETPGRSARNFALEVYHAQRDFWAAQKRWATNLTELKLRTPPVLVSDAAPLLEATPDGYVCSVPFLEGSRRRHWHIRQDRWLRLDEPLPVETELFLAKASANYGALGRRAGQFLVTHMPAADRATLSHEFLLENLALALAARDKFPWARNVPEPIFFNDVLPYASLDEPRDPWRAEFFALAGAIVRDCPTATAAAQALNRDLFQRLNVHYHLDRKRNNQSPAESIEQGKATCTGLAILLADACRAVGIPARLVGVPEWCNKSGNHTWVEIWDGDWFFTGADEFDPQGLNRAWFVSDAARTARSTNALNQVYASSWARTGTHFPLAWDWEARQVPGVNVSARYAAVQPAREVARTVQVRLRATPEGRRLAAVVELRSPTGTVLAQDHTRSDPADLNDMPEFVLPEATTNVTFRFVRGAEVREKVLPLSICLTAHTLEFVWSDLTPVPAR